MIDVSDRILATLKRLIVSLSLPPIIGTVVWYPITVISTPAYRWPESLVDHVGYIAVYISFGFLYCLIPGLLFWSVFELTWRLRPDWTRNRLHYSFIGCGLGLCAGSYLTSVSDSFTFLIAGAIAGFVTAWSCWSTVERPQTKGEIRLEPPI